MRLQKILKILSIVLLEAILLLAAGMLGMQNERAKIIQEEQAETVTDIAVVNLDKGVYEQNATKYYSNELMNLELDNLVAENLEAARQGIYNGSYAAYIIIPSEFSENAVSLNSVPTKSMLEFAVNPNLREDVSRLTMANLKNFEINLNTNMSYMYVQAILEEFHSVQDSAGIIMRNDSDEMARILGIAPENLMASPDPFEVEWADPDIEDVDFEEAFETNSQIAVDLRENYDDFVTQGEDAFEAIKEGEAEVEEGMDTFLDMMMEIDIETDEEGNIVYEQGLDELSLYVEEYEEEFIQQKNKVFEMIDAVAYVTPTPSPSSSISPLPTNLPTITPGGEGTPVPTATPASTPTITPTAAPEVSPTGDPTASAAPGEIQEASPTPTATPEIIPIPEIIKKTLDDSLNKANQKIAENNVNTENQIKEIKQTIVEIRLLLGLQSSSLTYGVLVQEDPAASDDADNMSDEGDVKEQGTEDTEEEKDTEDQQKPKEETASSDEEKPDNETVSSDEKEPDDGTTSSDEKESGNETISSDEKNLENESISGSKEEVEDEITSGGEVFAKITIRKPLPILMSSIASAGLTVNGAALTSNQTQQLTELLEKLEEALDKIEPMEKMTIEEIYDEEIIRKEFQNLAKEIQALPELDVDEYAGLFEEKVIGPLQEEIMNENTKIQEEGSRFMEIQSEYMEELGLFDPYEYYDYEKMDELTAAFTDNIFELEEKVYQSQDGYLELIYDTVDTSNESMEAMQENLEEAYAGTEENVWQEVELAKQYRKAMNETNIEILGSFKNKLPYTRIGKLEYVQAYDFMVKPIKMWDNSVTKSRVSFWQDAGVLRNILIGLIVVWGLVIGGLLVSRVYDDARESFEEE